MDHTFYHYLMATLDHTKGYGPLSMSRTPMVKGIQRKDTTSYRASSWHNGGKSKETEKNTWMTNQVREADEQKREAYLKLFRAHKGQKGCKIYGV